MTPRKDSNYHKLPSHLKALYLTGMPVAYLTESTKAFTFRNEKTSRGVLTQAVQRQSLEQFQNITPGGQQFTLFTSAPTDHEALVCCTQLLRHHYEKSRFFDFEFISPTEPLPESGSPEKIRSLYVLMGVNFKDEATTHLVRRWVRAPLGAAVWVIGTGEAPMDWATLRLGVKPGFLFSLKDQGTSVG